MFAAPSPKRRETILTSSGCETSLGIVRLRCFLDPATIAVEDSGHQFRCQLVKKVVIDLDGGRPAAGSDALHFLKRKNAVRCHAFMPDAKLFLEPLVDIVGSEQHATDVGADLDIEFACRLEAEHGVVRGHIADVERCDPYAPGNFGDYRVREIAHFILRI